MPFRQVEVLHNGRYLGILEIQLDEVIGVLLVQPQDVSALKPFFREISFDPLLLSFVNALNFWSLLVALFAEII